MLHRTIIPLLMAAGVAGCTITPVGSAEVTSAQVQPAGPLDVEVAAPGIDIETAPQIIYDGRPTYFYRNQWYYRGADNHWRYYRSEPNVLLEHRRNFQLNQERGNVQRGREFNRGADHGARKSSAPR